MRASRPPWVSSIITTTTIHRVNIHHYPTTTTTTTTTGSINKQTAWPSSPPSKSPERRDLRAADAKGGARQDGERDSEPRPRAPVEHEGRRNERRAEEGGEAGLPVAETVLGPGLGCGMGVEL
jgi:hypothetical protein